MYQLSDIQKAICALMAERTQFEEKDIAWLMFDTQSVDDTLALMELASSTGKSLYAVSFVDKEW